MICDVPPDATIPDGGIEISPDSDSWLAQELASDANNQRPARQDVDAAPRILPRYYREAEPSNQSVAGHLRLGLRAGRMVDTGGKCLKLQEIWPATFCGVVFGNCRRIGSSTFFFFKILLLALP